MESTREQLDHHRFFKKMPAELLDRLADCAERVSFDEDEEILTEGSPANSFYAVLSGRVSVGLRTPNRGLATIETLHSGDILGWSWLIPPYRWNFDAIALEPVDAIEFHADRLRPFMDSDPQAAHALILGIAAVMEERLQSAGIRLLDLYGGNHDASS
ncbi:MAG: cyclic nucleotide-binding domain-containing protein [Candidatus Nanopelagicales bacterium]|nr:cyclic nucleotide-binding domain-containing protein [Candidatus Nanopelagicales bacterium]MDZ4248629.1 cyclic nucleotide-binding domain-containing protein [Candidatus Nanopelagicales bacterium]